MGNKKKRNHPDLEELLQRPWCYYCERDFDDLKILIDHQRAKHFKCEGCGRRLNTAGGLSVHMNQVHKETLTSIDNALPNRSNLDVEIFGTEGIPADIAEQHRQRVVTQYAQAEAERRAATGNPPPGSGASGESAAKKVKTESKEDIKKRMAEFKAKKAAAAAAAQQATPSPTASTPTNPLSSQPGSQATISHTDGYNSFPPQYGSTFQPPGQTFSPPQGVSSFSPPGNGMYTPPMGYGVPPPYTAPGNNYGSGSFANGPPPGTFPDMNSRMYGAGSPPMPFGQQGQFQTPLVPTSLPNGAPPAPSAPRHLSSPSGLPQRPAFGAPPVNAAIMQQMHQGHITSQPPSVHVQSNGSIQKPTGGAPGSQETAPEAKNLAATAAVAKPEPDSTAGKKSKKGDKSVRMIYSDDETSPEEKMSKLSKYAFRRDEKAEEELLQVDSDIRGSLSNPNNDVYLNESPAKTGKDKLDLLAGNLQWNLSDN